MPCQIEISLQQQLSSEQREQLFHWQERVFPIEGKAFEWAESSQHLLAKSHGKAIGHLGFGHFKIESAEKTRVIEVIGVGGVVVRPEYQGNKIPALLFEYLHQIDGFSNSIFTLFCPERLVSYYTKQGYTLYRGRLSVLQADVYKAIPPMQFMYRGKIDFGEQVKVLSPPW
ncbi:Acetyltransferase (GNAT) domain-containing protein [Alteromonadaceae bacterium Bs31]|nr:Acetyltransferase (GNAT) domain-containing protein [Alteromonadaceae bacterium Bs31]